MTKVLQGATAPRSLDILVYLIFSRNVVRWMVRERETAELAKPSKI